MKYIKKTFKFKIITKNQGLNIMIQSYSYYLKMKCKICIINFI